MRILHPVSYTHLDVYKRQVYTGGFSTYPICCPYVAIRGKGTEWDTLFNIRMSTLCTFKGKMYLGGQFTSWHGNPNITNIAVWEDTLKAVGTGLPVNIQKLVATSKYLYATDGYSLSQWDGSIWTTIIPAQSNYFYLYQHNDEIYLYGGFTSFGGNPNLNKVIKWNGTSLEPVFNDFFKNSSISVGQIEIVDDILYVAGAFGDADGNDFCDGIFQLKASESNPCLLYTSNGNRWVQV